MEKKKDDAVVIIYTNRKTKEYNHFERYYLTESLTIDRVNEYIKKFNESDKNNTFAEVCENKFVCQIIEDVQASYTFKNFIQDMRDILADLEDTARRFAYNSEELQDYLKDNYPANVAESEEG